MTSPQQYAPSTEPGARIQKDGDNWTLVFVRDFNHPPFKVWKALTDPDELRQWAPFESDRNLGKPGTATLTTVGAPKPHVTESKVTRAEAPKVLEFNWGEQNLRWELAPRGSGTRLTLWHKIDRKYIAMGAAGWHVCFDVLDQLLDGHPVGRKVGPDAIKFGDWQRWNAEYSRQFGVESPAWAAGSQT